MILNLFITFLLVFLNAFFVAAEFALVKVRESQIELKARAGNKLAVIARNMIEHLDSYLSATQLGITLASLGLGWIGEPVVSLIIMDTMKFLGITISPSTAHSIAVPFAFILITFLHIVFGELAPKSLAIQRSEQITLIITLPLRIFFFIFKPFIYILNSFANFILKLIGFPPVSESDQLHSSEELRFLLEESSKSGIIELTDHTLIDNIFEFSEIEVKQIMVPRNKIVAIESSMASNEILKKFVNEGYSRMPVYQGTIDNIIGLINSKDLVRSLANNETIVLEDILRKPIFVGEEEKIKKTLNVMKRNKVHIAIVLDEFGGTSGLVSMEDIIEEIIGEIQDEYDDEQPIVSMVSNGEYLVKATSVIDDVNDFLSIELPSNEEYETVGGMITYYEGRIPELNEVVNIGDYSITIVNRSKRMIETVKLKLISENQPTDK